MGEINMYGNFGGGQGGPRGSFSPVRVGDELDVKIEAVGEKGDGIAKKQGFVLFIPGVKEGDEVRIRVSKVLRKVGFAEVIGEAQGTPESDEKPAEAEEAPAAEQEEAPEDTEDFGEEEKKEDTEKATEETPEEIAEEPAEAEEEKKEE